MVAAPLVTVVVSTFNRAPTLRLALESIRRQSFTNWEAVVVGDACTDASGTMVVAMGDARFHWHNRAVNSGNQAFPNNDGIALARGSWVAYLGHDDLWLPWHLEEMVTCAVETNADFLHALCVSFTPRGLARCWGPPASGRDYVAHPFPPTSWMHRRDLGDRIGGWRDPALLDRPTDLDFQYRAAQAGARFAFSSRLSALNFPASQFAEVYANDCVPLHAPFARMMALDAAALERSLLEHLAEQLAQQQSESDHARIEGILARGGGPESVAAYQEQRRVNWRHRGLDDLPAPAPAPTIRWVTVLPEVGGAMVRIVASGITHEPWVLADGVPLETRMLDEGLLEAHLPLALRPVGPDLVMEIASGGGVSKPVTARIPPRDCVPRPGTAGRQRAGWRG